MKIICVALAAVLLSSCYTVRISAPADQEIILASRGELLAKEKHKEWFLLGGLVPLTENKASKEIKSLGWNRVRATTRFNMVDWLVSGLTLGIVVPYTVILEGTKDEKK